MFPAACPVVAISCVTTAPDELAAPETKVVGVASVPEYTEATTVFVEIVSDTPRRLVKSNVTFCETPTNIGGMTCLDTLAAEGTHLRGQTRGLLPLGALLVLRELAGGGLFLPPLGDLRVLRVHKPALRLALEGHG
jgi:hypothetical protein